VTGWRKFENAGWRVKVWPVGRPSDWIGYTVAAGIFELTIVAQAHRDAVLHVIGEWERNRLPIALVKRADKHRRAFKESSFFAASIALPVLFKALAHMKWRQSLTVRDTAWPRLRAVAS
jgi:hypothetical protein